MRKRAVAVVGDVGVGVVVDDDVDDDVADAVVDVVKVASEQ